MSANQRTRWSAILWRAVCRAGRALCYIHGEQAWEVWAQVGQAPWPETGPLTWVRTLDGYQLAGSHLPGQQRPHDRGNPVTPGPPPGRPASAPAYYLGRPASSWLKAARRRRAAPAVDREPPHPEKSPA